jgi:hypothetical protein
VALVTGSGFREPVVAPVARQPFTERTLADALA